VADGGPVATTRPYTSTEMPSAAIRANPEVRAAYLGEDDAA
jgi:hypothetical protein